MILIPGTILGERYEIIEKIGAGGMSIVYKAKCNRLQRFVAVKVLREEFVKDEVFVNKFKVEALSAASLSHPNIVGIYDVGNDQDLHYIVMEYVEGQTLKDLIAKEGPLAQDRVLEYGLQMLGAIRNAHQKQIIHRDIKPQNILVTSEKVLKVTDFGIARAVDSSTIVATGNAIGSVHYFSPEQAKGKYVDITSDLYSCGIVLFELATKRLPFEADSQVSIALKHINEEIPKPSSFNSAICKGLEQIILKATNKKPELRYQSADEMIEDIKEVRVNPNYEVTSNNIEEEMGSTVLLTEAETSYLREHEKQIETAQTQEAPKSKVLEIEEVYDGDFDEDEKVKSGYKVLAGLAGVLAAMLLAGIVGVLLIGNLPKLAKTEAVVVPKIEGMLLEEAEAVAKERGLTLKQVSQEESESQQPGTILRQSPKGEATISKNGVIQIVVAIEPKVVMIEVPDVVGVNQADAQRLLETKGLYGKIEERVHDKEVEVGNIISQSPESGKELQEGEVVKLIVSKGAEMVMTNVPNLLGLTREDAEFSLKKEKLMLGTITEEYSATVQQGRIMNQSVSANHSVEQGTLINVVVSKGPEEVKPPEEVPPEEEVTPEVPQPEVPKEEEVAKPEQVTKQHTINLPQGKDQDEYHVVVIFQTDQGTQTLFDGIIKRDEFPKTISITGVGSGQLITHFDGQVEYNDDYSF